VTLSNGDQIVARIVISAADTRTTFTKLVDPYYLDTKFSKHVSNIQYNGTMARVHFALNSLPEFSRLNGSAELLSGHIQISPSITYLQKAYDPTKYGEFSNQPYLDIQIPTLTDPSLAPEGQHILSATVKYMPYKLKTGHWDELRETVAQIVSDAISTYAPNFGQCIQATKVITPLDMERTYQLPEGHPAHGEMTLNQFMWMRPIPGYAQYNSPIAGLYLCSAATHPGAGVTGLGGRNTARQILKDLK